VWLAAWEAAALRHGTFATAADVRSWLDPHREWKWDDGGETLVVAMSRAYKLSSDPRRLNREGE
jgi:hypothetical protein